MARPEFRWVDEPTGAVLEPGATVMTSFPSAGLAATVAAHYIVRTLGLPRIGAIESPDTPPIAVVQSGHVQPPVRVYGRKDIALVLSEFPPRSDSAGPIAQEVLAGAVARKARRLIALEGVVPHPVLADEGEGEEAVWFAGPEPGTELATGLRLAQARPLDEGVIGGVSGALLVASLRSAIPVAVLLVSARAEGFPDHRAGALLIETIDRLLPEVTIDTGPLRSQAEEIEQALRAAMQKATRGSGGEAPDRLEPTIYQ
ncbi:MAG: PAC2 family protein [Thermoplasmata archaeon]|nr:PAC2 family protein [Thermoplasmata archaeon]